MKAYLYLIITILMLMPETTAARKLTSKDAFRDSVVNHIFSYASVHRTDTFSTDQATYAYTKFVMRTNHRNFTLALVPTMYAIAHGGGRQYMGEYYTKFYKNEKNENATHRLLTLQGS